MRELWERGGKFFNMSTNNYIKSLIRAVAFNEGISHKKARSIVTERVKEVKQLNKELGKDGIKINPYRQFENEYFGGEDILYNRSQVIQERFKNFSEKYGDREVEFTYNNKRYTMTMNEVINGYANGDYSPLFIRRAIQALENRYADYIKANYHRH